MTTTPEQDKEKEEDDNMTMAEREQWLRDRGVFIENPSDRAVQAAATNTLSITQQLNNLELTESLENAVKFVFIPQDTTKPLQTLKLPSTINDQKTAGDALPSYVQSHFADSKAIDASLLQQQATKHFAGGQLEGLANTTTISPAAMTAVAAQGAVETFPLVHPATSNQYTGVYIYLDEVGLLKKLPLNTRATQLATACGYSPPPQFYGDVFVGRVQTKPVMHNIHFTAGKDTDPSSSAWLQRAPQENIAWQQEMNAITGKQGATQPAHAGTDGNTVEEDSFAWTQQDDDLEVTVTLEETIDKKQLKVKFASKSITVTYKGESKLALKLYNSIDVDCSTWTIEDGTKLVLQCEKTNGGELWPKIKG